MDFIEQAMPGDLAYFENTAGAITHTGILLPDGKVIHTAEQVRIDKIDHFGIFDEETSRYTYRLRVAKRLLKQKPSPLLSKKKQGKNCRKRLCFKVGKLVELGN